MTHGAMPRLSVVTRSRGHPGPVPEPPLKAYHVFARIRRRAEVRPLPPYSLRHAAASILLGAGVPVAVAAKMMGHSVTMFCETYADLLLEATRDAARQADAWLARSEGSMAPGAHRSEQLVDGKSDGKRQSPRVTRPEAPCISLVAVGAGGGTRTRTPLPARDFKSPGTDSLFCLVSHKPLNQAIHNNRIANGRVHASRVSLPTCSTPCSTRATHAGSKGTSSARLGWRCTRCVPLQRGCCIPERARTPFHHRLMQCVAVRCMGGCIAGATQNP